MAINIVTPEVSDTMNISRLAQQILQTGLNAPIERANVEQNTKASQQQVTSQKLRDFFLPQEMQMKEKELEANIKNQELLRSLQVQELGARNRGLDLERLRLNLSLQQEQQRNFKESLKENLISRLSSKLLGGEKQRQDANFVGAMPAEQPITAQEAAAEALRYGMSDVAKPFLDMARLDKSLTGVDKTFLIQKPDGTRETFYGTKEQAQQAGKILGATSRPDLDTNKNELRKLNIPEFELADPENILPDQTTRRELTKTYSSFKSFNDGLIPKLKTIIEDAGTKILPGKAKTKLKNLYAQYKLDYKEIYKLGALQEGEIALLNDVLLNPTTASLENIVSNKDFALTSIEQFSKNLKDKVRNDFIASGYKPTQSNPLYIEGEDNVQSVIPEVFNNTIEFNDY